MTVEISKIKITNRVRKEIAKIAELSEDIQANGLINPITVMSLEVGEYQLLAGLRRLRATEMLGHDVIAVHVVSPLDAEAMLRIEISENEQREPFTFSEKMDYAELFEAIEQAKAKERMSLGGKGGIGQEGVDDRPPLEKKKCRDAIGEKIGMSGRQYSRAKHIAENASDEILEELDNGQCSISKAYDELKAKEKAVKEPQSPSDTHDDAEDVLEDTVSDTLGDNSGITDSKAPRDSEKPTPPSVKSTSKSDPNGLFTKAELDAAQRNNDFHAMSDADKVVELQRQLKEERKRAATAESELSRHKDFHKNAVYHKDGIIANLSARLESAETSLETAEARIKELEALYCPDEED